MCLHPLIALTDAALPSRSFPRRSRRTSLRPNTSSPHKRADASGVRFGSPYGVSRGLCDSPLTSPVSVSSVCGVCVCVCVARMRTVHVCLCACVQFRFSSSNNSLCLARARDLLESSLSLSLALSLSLSLALSLARALALAGSRSLARSLSPSLSPSRLLSFLRSRTLPVQTGQQDATTKGLYTLDLNQRFHKQNLLSLPCRSPSAPLANTEARSGDVCARLFVRLFERCVFAFLCMCASLPPSLSPPLSLSLSLPPSLMSVNPNQVCDCIATLKPTQIVLEASNLVWQQVPRGCRI